jgi:hypothetical protein
MCWALGDAADGCWVLRAGWGQLEIAKVVLDVAGGMGWRKCRVLSVKGCGQLGMVKVLCCRRDKWVS